MKSRLLYILLSLLCVSNALAQSADTFAVYFKPNDAHIDTKTDSYISKLIADDKLIPGSKLTLLGYADNIGTSTHNDSLSQSRAENVRDYLLHAGFRTAEISLCLGKGQILHAPAGQKERSLNRKVLIIAEPVQSTSAKAIKPKPNGDALKIEMVKVIGDTFRFAIGKYHITQAQWDAVMGRAWSRFRNCDSCPVLNVSWHDAHKFMQKLNDMTGENYRLPTQAEWIYAAKGGTKGHNYYFAGSNDVSSVAWHSGNSNNRTHPVGQKLPNELGIYDMTGNAWQLCADTAKGDCALRGGAWFLRPPQCRITYGAPVPLHERNDAIGFRVAYSL